MDTDAGSPRTKAERRAGALWSDGQRAPWPLPHREAQTDQVNATWRSGVSRLLLERLPCPSASFPPQLPPLHPHHELKAQRFGGPRDWDFINMDKQCLCVRTQQPHCETAKLIHRPVPWRGCSQARLAFSLRFTFPGWRSSVSACVCLGRSGASLHTDEVSSGTWFQGLHLSQAWSWREIFYSQVQTQRTAKHKLFAKVKNVGLAIPYKVAYSQCKFSCNIVVKGAGTGTGMDNKWITG